MTAPLSRYRTVAWNGIRISLPHQWQTTVRGDNHLQFTRDLDPVVEIRWRQKKGGLPRVSSQLEKQAATLGLHNPPTLPPSWQQIKRIHDNLHCWTDANGNVRRGVFSCRKCSTLLLFQVLQPDKYIPEILGSFVCHGFTEGCWAINDLGICTPKHFSLQSYRFGAGLSHLRLQGRSCRLAVCTLTPAHARLRQSSLSQILTTLVAAADFSTVMNENDLLCEGSRDPRPMRQLLLRLRRELPFIRGRIRHDRDTNRLLALVLWAARPQFDPLFDTLTASYESFPYPI